MYSIANPIGLKMRGMVRLTRWKEYIPFVIPVTLFGVLLASQASGVRPDWRLLVVILANTLVVAYAFMINDIEDAPDDALEAHRAARNPITNGEITPREGWAASLLVAALTLAMYAIAGLWPLLIGALTLALSHLYSWKLVRLKAWPVTDVVSHSLMLSGLLFLAGYFAYNTQPGPAWSVALALTLVSSYGQLYNQLRDYNMDKAAGLRNTAILLGKNMTQILMYIAIGLAGGLLVYALATGVIPLWIVIAPLVAVPFFFIFRFKGDMRGGVAADISGSLQVQILALANIATVVWLGVTLIGLA